MRRDRNGTNWPVFLLGTLVSLVPLAGFATMALNNSHIQGGFLLDTGLLASLIWHSDWTLTELLAMGGCAYLVTHMAPIFLLLPVLSRILPLGTAQYFVLVVGASYALLALGVLWLLVQIILATWLKLSQFIFDDNVAALAPRAFTAANLLGLKCLPPQSPCPMPIRS